MIDESNVQEESVELRQPDPVYINLFNISASQAEVIFALGTSLPELGTGPSKMRETFYARYIATRQAAAAFAHLLARVLWGEEVEKTLPPSP